MAPGPHDSGVMSAPAANLPLEKRPDRASIVLSTLVLSMASGMVNMFAFYELGVLISHQTGNTCHLSRNLEASLAVKIAAAFVAFSLGCIVAGGLQLTFESFLTSQRSLGLVLAGACVLFGTVLQWQLDYQTTSAIMLLSFSQGLQNSITTSCKAMPIRSTHMTGALTDAGMIIGHWLRAKILRTSSPNPWKPCLLLFSVAFFMVGSFIAKQLLDSIGVLTGLVPAVILLLTGGGVLLCPFARREQKLLQQDQQQYATVNPPTFKYPSDLHLTLGA